MDEQPDGVRRDPLKGAGHAPWLRNALASLEGFEQIPAWRESGRQIERVAVTVLFTDIVDSTAKVAALGDRHWHALLDSHHALVRRALAGYRGREIDTTGDSFFAAFECAARAIRCACTIADAVCPLGITVRAGLHAGECEVMDKKLGGLTVHIGARVVMLAGAGEVLVSGAVKDLVTGSGFTFLDRGIQSLKGVPGEWRLYVVHREPPFGPLISPVA